MEKSEVSSQKLETVLVCFALKEESGPFRRFSAVRHDVLILITGIGRKNSETVFREFLTQSSPQKVFTCGFAGGLDPKLAIGDVIFETGDDVLRQKLAAANAKPAKIFCASRVATNVAEKKELRRTTGADAVEMESEAIHAVCREHGIPCATVRVISDTAREDLPLDFNRLSKPDLSMDYRKLAWDVAKSPGKIPALLRLQKNCRQAAVRLTDVLMQVIGPK